MPCKNAGAFLSECLHSISQQTYSNWELILCDDHSTDNSVEIAQNFKAKKININIVNNRGNGILDALHTAYSVAQGNYITRMDADDIMPIFKLEKLRKLLGEESYLKVATGKVQYFPEADIQAGFKAYESWMNGLIDQETHWQEVYKECVIASPCWMMDRKSFEQIGGFGSNYPEDYDLVWRMFTHGISIISSKEVLHLWRDHANRASRNNEVYQSQTFFKLKIKYMLTLPSFQNKKLVVWGAGKKGKELVRELLTHRIQPLWVSNNYKKIGHNIYNIILANFTSLPKNKSDLIILITISNPDEQKDTLPFLHQKGYSRSIDYFILA